jgi:hypothetical protein
MAPTVFISEISFFGWSSRSGTREYFLALAGLVGLVQENTVPVLRLHGLVGLVQENTVFSCLGWSWRSGTREYYTEAGLVGLVQENTL